MSLSKALLFINTSLSLSTQQVLSFFFCKLTSITASPLPLPPLFSPLQPFSQHPISPLECIYPQLSHRCWASSASAPAPQHLSCYSLHCSPPPPLVQPPVSPSDCIQTVLVLSLHTGAGLLLLQTHQHLRHRPRAHRHWQHRRRVSGKHYLGGQGYVHQTGLFIPVASSTSMLGSTGGGGEGMYMWQGSITGKENRTWRGRGMPMSCRQGVLTLEVWQVSAEHHLGRMAE